MIIDIGGGTTDIAIYHDNVIQHTAVIPFGGDVVTNDIKEGLNILRDRAERLKTEFGSAIGDTESDDVLAIRGINGREAKEISPKSLAYIIQYRMQEIIDAVCYEIDYSGYGEKLGAGIVITGGGSMLKNLVQLFKFKTGLHVKIGRPGENLTCELVDEITHPKYSTSVGLVLKGFEQDGIKMKKESNSGRKSFKINKKEKNRKGSAVQLSFSHTFGKIKDNLGNFFYEDNDSPM
jgi:cell division protein FtsA